MHNLASTGNSRGYFASPRISFSPQEFLFLAAEVTFLWNAEKKEICAEVSEFSDPPQEFLKKSELQEFLWNKK